ncbi:hypothetical protein F5X68DRAFT_25175 [Plectosphaerella plurivora]|uniref:BTB domain-containing protein n=1 Tax=Plectosphaerella plurivora TaxID=936078 RepID=A0A9P9A6Q3_9PEZI|nr:hypothetical protein F5X68DRAFT_25175 [Plectosphaerella plurivora]
MAPSSAKTAKMASASPTATTPTEVHVTSIPDVCLAFSSGHKIFANVAVLRNASPVFRAMPGPYFQEGQSIINNPTKVQDISLPEDNPQAMLTVARLLHHHCRDVELDGQLEAESIFNMAVLADKYDVCHVVKSSFPTFVSLDKITPTDMWYLLSAAHIVGHRDIFKKVSAKLVLEHSKPYMGLLKLKKTCRESDLWLVTLLEARRAWLKCKISTDIIYNYDEIKSHLERLSPEGDMISNAARIGYRNSLETTLETLQDAIDAQPPLKLTVNIEDSMKELKDKIAEGICFDCVGTTEMNSEHSGKKKKTT